MKRLMIITALTSAMIATSASAQWIPCANLSVTCTTQNVGIGTTTPSQLLHVLGNVAAPVRQVVQNLNGGGTADSIWQNDVGAALAFQLGGSTKPGLIWGLSWSNMGRFTNTFGPIGVGTDNAFPLYLATNSSVRMTIDTAGRVGIGTGAPTQALDVNGNINVSGNINAKYQDFAEWVPAATTMDPGTVVVLDGSHSNEVIASKTAYDTSVAGVISKNPGVALGEASPSKVLVATSGRVRVKVDATKGPIRIGDLLVTSNKPGMAMKSEPIALNGVKIHRPRNLIGKALEPLDKGQGEILVLLSMQ